MTNLVHGACIRSENERMLDTEQLKTDRTDAIDDATPVPPTKKSPNPGTEPNTPERSMIQVLR